MKIWTVFTVVSPVVSPVVAVYLGADLNTSSTASPQSLSSDIAIPTSWSNKDDTFDVALEESQPRRHHISQSARDIAEQLEAVADSATELESSIDEVHSRFLLNLPSLWSVKQATNSLQHQVDCCTQQVREYEAERVDVDYVDEAEAEADLDADIDADADFNADAEDGTDHEDGFGVWKSQLATEPKPHTDLTLIISAARKASSSMQRALSTVIDKKPEFDNAFLCMFSASSMVHDSLQQLKSSTDALVYALDLHSNGLIGDKGHMAAIDRAFGEAIEAYSCH